MASTYSSILKLELIGNGDQSGTWGTTTNNNLGTLIEQAIAGTATIDVTSANVTLTDLNGVSDQARCAAILVSGTPGVSRNIVAPAVSKLYVISNGSNAAVVIKTSTSTGYTITAGFVVLVYFNGTDFVLVGQTATSSNVANTLVLRDASGNFSAGTITANLIGNATGLSATLAVASGGTGVTTSTGTGSVVLNTSPTLVTPALGTPSSGTLTNCTGLPVSSGISGLGTGVATFLGTPSSANLAAAVTDETGTGSLVFNTSPTLVTPALGTPSSGTLTNCTGYPTVNLSGSINLTTQVSGTLPVANGGTGVTTSTGSGSNVLNTSPTLVTPILGTPTSGTLTSCTGLPISTGVSGLGTNVATFLATPSSANLAAALTDETGTGSAVFATSPTLVTPALGTPTSGNFSTGTFTWPTFNQNTTGNAATATNVTGSISSAVTATTQTAGDNSTKVATTAYVATAVTNATGSLGTMSTQNANNVAITGGSISGISALPVASGGTGVTSSTGTGSVVLSSSPTLTTPALGTPSAVVLTNATGTANSLNAGIGVNQTWQDVTSSRAIGTTYTNSTGKPITVYLTSNNSTGNAYNVITVNGTTIGYSSNQYGGVAMVSTFIVPNGNTYLISASSGTSTIVIWSELR